MQQANTTNVPNGEHVARLKAAVAIHPLAHAPKLASALFHLCGNTNTNLAATAKLIADNDALAGPLIRLANRVQHGGGIAVTSAEAATVRLGAGRARSVAIARLFIERAMQKSTPEHDAQTHWLHAITRGCIARAIAMNTSRNLSCMALLVGILQDCALPILATTHESTHTRLCMHAQHNGSHLAVLESQELGFNHIHTAIHVLERWQAPTILIDAIGRHHARPPMVRTEQDALRLWQIAYFVGALPLNGQDIAHTETADVDTDKQAERWTDAAIPQMPHDCFDLTINSERLMEQARQEFDDVAEFFSPYLPTQIDFSAMTHQITEWLSKSEDQARSASTKPAGRPIPMARPDRMTPREPTPLTATRLNEDVQLKAQI